MFCEMKKGMLKRRGFSLIETVVAMAIMGILLGGSVPLILQSLGAKRERVTLERMTAIHEAIVGDTALGESGFFGDIGDFPGALSDLVSRPAGLSAFAFYTNNIGYGWRGPYLELEFGTLKDGWGNAFQYSTADGLPEGQIRSAGRDDTFGTSDDIVFPYLPSGEKVEKDATLLVTVQVDDTSVAADLQGGGVPNPRESTIKVYYASNGAEAATPFQTSASGTGFDDVGFVFSTHHGLHAVEYSFENDTGGVTTNLFTVELVGGVQSNIVFRHPQSGHIIP